MVIPIVAMLAVTMVVAGWQYEEESEQPEIEVQRGENETEISYARKGEPSVDYNRSVMANTTVDGETALEFEVLNMAVMSGGGYHWTYIDVTAEGSLPEELDLEEFRFEASEDGNISRSIFFERGSSMIDNGSVRDDLDMGPKEIFDLDENDFKAESSLVWSIPEGNWGEPCTLELTPVIDGLSEEVSASIEVHIEGFEEE